MFFFFPPPVSAESYLKYVLVIQNMQAVRGEWLIRGVFRDLQ